MPVLSAETTLVPTGIISDLKQDVLDALQGRTDISDTMIANYVAKTVIEVTESNTFEELRTTGPTFALTAGLAIYPIDVCLNAGDDYTSPESFGVYVDYPTNSVVSLVKYRTPKAMETMIAPVTQGVPAWFTRFGPNFHFGPTPNQPYSVFMRYQARHQFTMPTASISDPLYIARSWFDIVAYGAAMRIAIAKRWTDQRKELHDLLYGDPEFISSEGKKGRPGLISARMFQVERDQKFDSRQLMPLVQRYGPR